MRNQVIAVLILLCAISALADQIVLKNGDRITGTIAKSDGKELVIKTDYAGDVTVKFDAIQSLTSTTDLHVAMGGKTAVGPVTTNGDQLVVAAKTGSVEAPISSVSVLRSPAEEAAYQKKLHPGFAEGWAGGANLGFAITRGNSATKNLAVGFTAVRTGFHDKLSLYENTIYSTNDLTGATPHTTSNSSGGGILYTHDFTPRAFGFANADFFSNSLQFLDLRSAFGGGIGVHAVKTPNTTLDLLAGVDYTRESYSGAPTPPTSYTKNYGALHLGDNFTHKLGKATSIAQSFTFYPDLKDTSQYGWSLNAGTVTKLNKWLGWQNTFGDVYVSDGLRPVGTKANDVQFSTGLNISFTH